MSDLREELRTSEGRLRVREQIAQREDNPLLVLTLSAFLAAVEEDAVKVAVLEWLLAEAKWHRGAADSRYQDAHQAQRDLWAYEVSNEDLRAKVEVLMRVYEAAKHEELGRCYTPRATMTDIEGSIGEEPCGDCAGCHLNEALTAAEPVVGRES